MMSYTDRQSSELPADQRDSHTGTTTTCVQPQHQPIHVVEPQQQRHNRISSILSGAVTMIMIRCHRRINQHRIM